MHTGRSSFLVKVARYVQRIPLAWMRFIEVPFIYLRGRLAEPSMIILLALPRSGSTLTYQSLIHSFQPTYLSNLSNLLFQIPLVGGWLSKVICTGYCSDFTSNQGFVPGLCGPAEGFQFWSYWLNCGLDDREDKHLSKRTLIKREKHIKRVFSVLSKPEKPLITGYLGHTLKPHKILETFPKAVIVRLHREPISNALSILHGRKGINNSWLSLFPRECGAVLGEGLYSEVAAQVYWLNRRLDDSLLRKQVFHMNYEDLCKNPQAQLQKLANYCSNKGIPVTCKGDFPNEFKYKIADAENNEEANKVRIELESLENRYGKLFSLREMI